MTLFEFSWFIPVLIALAVWDIVWKLIALWKAARNGHLGWFIAIAIVNSVGVLPILYIFSIKKKEGIE
ncbi:MAG: DUF5652 family protein [Bacteroidota bacterium]